MIQKIEDNPELKKAVLQNLTLSEISPMQPSMPSVASVSPSQDLPSQKAMKMSHEEMCDWLREKKIAGKYLHLFEEDEMINGEEFSFYTEKELEELGVAESRIRIRILVQFRKI